MRKPPPHGQRSKSECAALTSSFDRNNSDGKATFKTAENAGNYNYQLRLTTSYFAFHFFYGTFL